MNVLKNNFNKFQNSFKNLKQKLTNLFLFENSIKYLSNTMKTSHLISIGFDEIYNGILNNPKRFKFGILIYIITWFSLLWHFLLLIPSVWALIDNKVLPYQLKNSLCCYFGGICLSWNQSN